MDNLKDKKVLVGVSGGIAAYKSCSLVNFLLKEGAEVKVVMTKAASHFVTPLTFQSLSHGQVYVDMWDAAYDPQKIEHIDLSHWADVIVVSPATANTIAKVSCGIADNLLTLVVLSSRSETPVLFVPAMNTHMLHNPITQRNIGTLKEFGRYHFMDTRKGTLACQDEGEGKIAKNEDVVEMIKKILG